MGIFLKFSFQEKLARLLLLVSQSRSFFLSLLLLLFVLIKEEMKFLEKEFKREKKLKEREREIGN